MPCKKSRLDASAKQLWRDGIYDQIREVMSMQGSLSIERMCQMARGQPGRILPVTAGQNPAEEDMEVRSAIQQIALEHRRRYGYRRITAELRRRGMLVNHKRVARLMREDNLLAMQPRQFVVTTDSNHELEVYLNLARRMKLTGIDQLWVADITYIRLRAEFVYLAVILDGFSAKSWAGHWSERSRAGWKSLNPTKRNCSPMRTAMVRIDARARLAKAPPCCKVLPYVVCVVYA